MEKKYIRAEIKRLKKTYSIEQLLSQSRAIMQKLEKHNCFVNSQSIMLYCSLPDEVQTMDFINKWRHSKKIILPTVVGDDIIPVELTDDTNFAEGDFHIQEPQNNPYKGSLDLIVVPGVAFDKNCNRIGRGRGYYDRFLCHYPNTKKIGICFDFQLVENIPTESNDIAVDEVISL